MTKFNGMTLFMFIVLASGALAQEARQKVLLPAESTQVRNRLRGIDGALPSPVRTPEAVAGIFAWLGHADFAVTPWNALASTLAQGPTMDEWEGLLDAYYRLARDAGDTLVALPECQPAWSGAGGSVQLRRLVHQRLAGLPRSVLEVYRQRVEVEAQKLLDEGRQTRSAAPLRRLVDELFCSRPADEALDLLGDLAFEQGHFEEALTWWRHLIAPQGRLLYPGPRVDLARVQGKQVLALAFVGDFERAQQELDVLRRRWPAARGHLAGQEGNYGAILQQALAPLRAQHPLAGEEAWPTFAGAVTRNGLVSYCPPRTLWEDDPTWHVPLPPCVGPRRAAYHPAIGQDQVLVPGPTGVVSYHLHTGKMLFRFEAKKDEHEESPASELRRARLPSYTVTVDGQCAYVRLGRQELAPGRAYDSKAGASYLVCLDLSPTARQRERWSVRAQADDGLPALFEGTPLVREGLAYVAVSRTAGRRTLTAVVCYDGRGKQRWAREVCDCPEFEEDVSPRSEQHLLTWTGTQLVYCSHAGASVALDPWTGQPLWALRYPRRGPLTADGAPSPRELAPCLYVDGRLLMAPRDADRLFCLEATTGRVLWEVEGVEVVHLLGAARGRVFFTTPRGLQAVSLASGAPDWQQPVEGRLPSLGRGLLLGDWLFWPTQDARLPLRAVNLTTGDQQSPAAFDPTQLRHIPAGNLALGQGCLVVAGVHELAVFVPPVPRPPLPAEGGPINRLPRRNSYDRPALTLTSAEE